MKTPKSERSPLAGWAFRVVLPAVVLLVLAGLVPSEKWWSRSGAQLAAVVAPLGIELIRSRWNRRGEREAAIADLRSRLDPLTAKPVGGSTGLDDPAYEITPCWGRTDDAQRLNAARLRDGPVVIVVSGGAWVGKTRLLIDWAAALPEYVLAGWLPTTGDSTHLIREANRLAVPAVFLHRGSDADLAGALTVVAGIQAEVTVVVERRDASQLAHRMRAFSPPAGRAAESATEITIKSPGSADDMDHRYGDMVVAYERAVGISRSGPRPRSPRQWTSEPIGLVSALAMFDALRLAPNVGGLSAMEAFGQYWSTVVNPWIREGPTARFGLPPLSDIQMEFTLVLLLITNGEGGSAIRGLPLFEKLGAHEAQQLALWAREVTRPAQGRSTELAAVAATQTWTEDQQWTLGAALQSGPRQALVHVVRLCVIAEQVFGETPAITSWAVGSDFDSLSATLTALKDEIATAALDTLIAAHVAASSMTLPQVEGLMAQTTFDRLPQTYVTLMNQQLKQTLPSIGDEKCASMRHALAACLNGLGEAKEALPHAEVAVEVYRRLADPRTGDPDRYDTALACCLDTLATILCQMGLVQKALPPAEEAVEVYRRLADPSTGSPDRYDAYLAHGLSNLAVYLAESGRDRKALPPAEEAVEVYRRLADPSTGSPDQYDAYLADSLSNLANRFGELGRIGDAVSPAEEAVAVYRRLADPSTGDPDRYDAGLARCLVNLSIRLSDEGQGGEALPPAEEAVNVYRRLTDPSTGDPDRYEGGLARCLHTLALRLGHLGRHMHALTPAEEAVRVYRRLADPSTGNPGLHDAQLADCLSDLAIHLSELGRVGEAIQPAEEAVEVYRRLADPSTGNPDRYDEGLARCLSNLAIRFSRFGSDGEAIQPAEEAVEMYRRLADPSTGNPDRYDEGLANGLSNLAVLLGELGQDGEALSPAEEAVEVYRRLADPSTGDPDRYDAGLAHCLSNLATRLSRLGRDGAALPSAEEAVKVYRRLADGSTDSVEGHISRLRAAERRVLELKFGIEEGHRS